MRCFFIEHQKEIQRRKDSPKRDRRSPAQRGDRRNRHRDEEGDRWRKGTGETTYPPGGTSFPCILPDWLGLCYDPFFL